MEPFGKKKMMRKTPQQKLEAFYRHFKARKPAKLDEYVHLIGPDLICLDEQYLNSSPRIVIIGQQIGNWDYNYPKFVDEWSVKEAIKEYQDFDFAFSDKEIGFRGTPFWQFFHKGIREHIFSKERELHRKVLWTNLVKFVGKGGQSLLKQPFAKTEMAIQLQEDILINELKIAKADVCIFVTGPDYDCLLRRYFKGIKFESLKLSEKQFARLHHRHLPYHSYRTYHPRYLRQKKLWDRVLKSIRYELRIFATRH